MKTKLIFLVMLALIPAFIFISCPAYGQDNKNENNSFQKTGTELNTYFNKIMATQKYAGLGACIVKGDRIIWQGSYGYSDINAHKPLTNDNIFLLSSLSKTVTATALMQLYEKGLFKLEDDVNNYLPFKVRNPNFPEKPITFRMLLTHRGGFADVYSSGNKIDLGVDGDSPIPFDEYVAGLFTPGGKYYSKDYFSTNEPGTKHEYSNIAFSLIGYLVEKISKKDFSDYCKENIFTPLEMNNTGWHLKDLNVDKIVFPYTLVSSDNPVYNKEEHFGMPGYPEGMLRTSIHDFANFLSAFINKGRYKEYQMLKPETVALMLAPQGIKNIPSRSFKITDIGLTWIINDVEGEELYSMNGFSPSFFSNAYFSTKDTTAIIYYYTGISMQNMPAMADITKKLVSAIKALSDYNKSFTGPPEKTGADLDTYFTNIVSTQNYVGLGACLIKEDNVIWQGAYGYADFENKKILTADNIFQLASLSKTVTATALMQLYEKGLFKLDDDVNNYIPIKVRNPNFPDKPVTFRMLLTHTGGFEDVAPDRNKLSLGSAGDSPIPLSDFVEGIFTPGGKYYSTDYFSKSEPGTKYGYSNIAFALIGYIVEKITKKDFSEYCNEAIFRPMGMNNTSWRLKGMDTARIAFGYGFPKSDSIFSYKKVGHFGVPGYPEGMLRTTLQDFAKFISAFISNGRYKDYQMLKPETVELMLTPAGVKNIPSRSGPVKDIGLCWLIFDESGSPVYSMNGFSGSIFTNTKFSIKDRTAFIYYYTGISMKNMQGSFEINEKLKAALKAQGTEL